VKVGDYVRTIYGIKKVVDIICGQDIKFDNTNGFDEDLRKYHDYDGISFEGSAWREIVERTSPNIIDLIEDGDIVKILNGMGEEELILIKYLEIEKPILESHKIISILTKEQFESMEYKVE